MGILWEICAEETMTGDAVALANQWEQIKARLTTKVSPRAYEDWVLRTAFESADGNWLASVSHDRTVKVWDATPRP